MQIFIVFLLFISIIKYKTFSLFFNIFILSKFYPIFLIYSIFLVYSILTSNSKYIIVLKNIIIKINHIIITTKIIFLFYFLISFTYKFDHLVRDFFITCSNCTWFHNINLFTCNTYHSWYKIS